MLPVTFRRRSVDHGYIACTKYCVDHMQFPSRDPWEYKLHYCEFPIESYMLHAVNIN